MLSGDSSARDARRRATGSVRRRQSYSGLHVASAEVRLATDADDVATVLREARGAGRGITLAGAGLSFDAQSLGDDLVLSTRRIDHIHVEGDEAGEAVLRVGPGARWADIARAAAAAGRLVPVMVSSGEVTAGGTVATNGLSRFSPVFGKEGRWIRAVRVLMPDGTALRASREAHPEVFFAVVGGLGLVGVLIEIEYLTVPAQDPLRVQTWVERRPSLEGLGPALRVEASHELAAPTPFAVIAPRGDELRVMISRSRYVSGVELEPMVPYRPQSALRVPLELAIQNLEGMGRRFWGFAYDHYVREDRPYVDELFGYTFFMDGNVRARRLATRLGLRFRTAQQTFVLPSGGGDAALLDFVSLCHRRVREARLGLAMFDVLHLPADEPFALSSSRVGAGYAVTLTFDGRLGEAERPRLIELLEQLSRAAERAGGRVHLTKNVWAAPEVLERMYRDGLEHICAVRRRFDPEGTLGTRFAARLFPSRFGPSSPRARSSAAHPPR